MIQLIKSCNSWISIVCSQETYKKFIGKILKAKLKNSNLPAYRVKTFVLNSSQFGLAQNRERLYMVGVRQSSSGLKRPLPVIVQPKTGKPELKDFLRPLSEMAEAKKKKLGTRGKKVLKWAQKKLQNDNAKIAPGDDAVVDTAAGRKFRQVQVGRCPTITKSRGATASFYLMQRKRPLDCSY